MQDGEKRTLDTNSNFINHAHLFATYYQYPCDLKGIESSPQTLLFLFNILATQCRRPQLLQTMNSVKQII